MKLYLASSSPRRRELLSKLCYDFEIVPSDADESVIEALPPEEYVTVVALRKLAAVTGKLTSPCAIIAADTIVFLEGQIFGKPYSEDSALKMLTALSGRIHYVYTGVQLMFRDKYGHEKTSGYVCRTSVKLKAMTEDEIKKYIATGEPMDKAGAYAIQGQAGLVEYIDGDYNNVVGLPTDELIKRLAAFGIVPKDKL